MTLRLQPHLILVVYRTNSNSYTVLKLLHCWIVEAFEATSMSKLKTKFKHKVEMVNKLVHRDNHLRSH